MSAGIAGISGGSVFVSIKADLAPFRASLGGLQKQIAAMGSQFNTSLNFPQQALRMGTAAEMAGKDVATFSRRFFGLTRNILTADAALKQMMATMQAGGIKFTRMGNAVAAVSTASATLAKANPIDDSWSSSMEAFNRRMYYGVRAIKQASTAMLGFSAVILGPIALGAKSFMPFEQQMKRVQLLTKTTGSAYETLEKEAMRLGAVTSYTASQAAEGMKELAQGGMNAAQVMSSIGAVLNLGKIGDIGLGEAAKIVIRVSNAFGLLAQDASFVSDVIAKTAMSSSTNVSEMASAFKYVAGTARALNQSIEETGTLLAVLADNGVPASMAGRTLNQAFRQLLQKQGKIKELYGIVLQDPSTGGLRAFTDIVKDLNNAMANKAPLERQQELFEIFGVLGGRAVSALMQSGDALDTMGKKVRDNVGFAQKIADELMKTLEGEFRRTKAAMENLAFALTKALTPAIRSVFKDVQKWANTLAKQPELLREWGTWLLSVGKYMLGIAIAMKVMAAALTVLLFGLKAYEGASLLWKHWGKEISTTTAKVRELSIAVGTQLYGAMAKLATKGQDLGKIYTAISDALSTTAAVHPGRSKGFRPPKPNDWVPMRTIPFPMSPPKKGFFDAIKKAFMSLKTYIVTFAGSITGIVSGAITTGFGVLAVSILAVAQAFIAVYLAAKKWYDYVADKAGIKTTNDEIEEQIAHRKKLIALGKVYDKRPQKGDFSDVLGLKAMAREGKTAEEIQRQYYKSVRASTEAIKRQQTVIKLAKAYGSVQSDDVSLAYLATLEQKHKALLSMRESLFSTPAIDPMFLEGEAEAWESMFASMKASRQQFVEAMQDKDDKKAITSMMDALEKITEIDPQNGIAKILQAKAAYEEDAKKLLESINAQEEQVKRAAASGERGMTLFYGDDEGKKAFADSIAKDWTKLSQLRDIVDQLGDAFLKAGTKTVSFRQSVLDSMRSIQAERAKTLEERRFSKMQPDIAQQYVKANLALVEAAGKKAEREFERLNALAKKDPSYKGQLEAAGQVLLDKQKELYMWQDRAAGLQEKSVNDTLAEKSIGFWGSQNPLEMLGGGTVKVDQKLLAESIKQTKSLANIEKNLAPYGHFY